MPLPTLQIQKHSLQTKTSYRAKDQGMTSSGQPLWTCDPTDTKSAHVYFHSTHGCSCKITEHNTTSIPHRISDIITLVLHIENTMATAEFTHFYSLSWWSVWDAYRTQTVQYSTVKDTLQCTVISPGGLPTFPQTNWLKDLSVFQELDPDVTGAYIHNALPLT